MIETARHAAMHAPRLSHELDRRFPELQRAFIPIAELRMSGVGRHFGDIAARWEVFPETAAEPIANCPGGNPEAWRRLHPFGRRPISNISSMVLARPDRRFGNDRVLTHPCGMIPSLRDRTSTQEIGPCSTA